MTSHRADPFSTRMDLRQGHADLGLTHKAIPIPDLRFEYTYLKNVWPHVRLERTGGQSSMLLEKTDTLPAKSEVVRVQWGRVLWVTVRDQLLSPFVQGAIWGMVSMYVLPVLAIYKLRIRSWWQRGETYVPGRRTDGGGVGALRNWVSSLTTASPKGNAAMSSMSR